MRGVAYALIASGALMISALASGSASAGCYRDCDDDYQSGPSYYRSAPRSYERFERYDDRPAYRSYREPCCERPAYYEGPRYHTTYYERPAYRTSYDDGYYQRPYHYHHHHYRPSYYSDYRSYYYPTVGYGGAWSQTGPAYTSWSDCHSAYIPYGWTWYRASSC